LTQEEGLQAEGNKPGFFYGYVVVAASFLIMVLAWGAFYTFGVFFKPVLAEFDWTRAITSGAYSLGVILLGLLSIAIGRLTDKLGPRIIVTICGLFFGVGYLLMSQISTIWQIYVFHGIIVAAGLTGAWVPLLSTVIRWFVSRKGLMTGIIASGIGIGTIIVPPVAERLISVYGWRTSYIFLGIAVLVLIVTAAQFLRRDPTQMRARSYGEGNEVKEDSLELQDGGISLQKAIRSGQFWMLCAIFLSFGFCLDAIIVHIVPHVTEFGISAATAANVLATIGGASIIGRIGVGIIADRIGDKPACVIGFVIMTLALLWLQLAGEVWMFYLFAVVYGFAYGGLVTLISTMVAGLFGLSSHGAILGFVTFGATIGESAGPFMAGRIFDVTGSYQLAFLIFTVTSAIGLVLTLLLRPTSINKGGEIKK
jgi:MFS family permease